MYRILLVDDESQIRSGLKRKIDWESAGFILCGEAANGQEALEQIEALKPHVVLTDIRMPVMDGLALLNICKKQYPDIELFVLSGYDEFHFVREAMKCGARDYLLKPVVRKELKELLVKIAADLAQRKEEWERHRQLQTDLDDSLQRLREHFWLQAVRSSGERDSRILNEARRLGLEGLLAGQAMLQFVTVEIRDARHASDSDRSDELLLLAAHLLSRELLEMKGTEGQVFRDPGHHSLLHLVLHIDDFGPKETERWLRNEYQAQLDHILKLHSVIGIGEPVSGPGELRKGFLSSRWKWMELMPVNKDYESTELAVHREEGFELSHSAERQLSTALEEGEMGVFHHHISSMFKMKGPMSLRDISMRNLRLLLFIDQFTRKNGFQLDEIQQMLSGLPDSIWNIDSPEAAEVFFTRIARLVIESLQKHAMSNKHGLIEQIESYLLEHYASEDVSLSQLAERFHINSTYLSELFKKQTGQNYSEYLKELRISKAKELLSDPLLRISDIADLVGFMNPNYFSQVFKKTTGLSPNDYRQWLADPMR